METRITEVADGVHQLSTFVGAPVGFNQYLIVADEPLLFHTGMRQMFPLVFAAVSKIVPGETLRWLSFGRVEADEPFTGDCHTALLDLASDFERRITDALMVQVR